MNSGAVSLSFGECDSDNYCLDLQLLLSWHFWVALDEHRTELMTNQGALGAVRHSLVCPLDKTPSSVSAPRVGGPVL